MSERKNRLSATAYPEVVVTALLIVARRCS